MMETTGLGTAWDLQGSEEKLAGVGGELSSSKRWGLGLPHRRGALCRPRPVLTSQAAGVIQPSPAQPCVLVHGLVFSSSG